MNKKILISLIAATSIVYAAQMLETIPLESKFVSTDNGGDISAIDAYKDGVGIFVSKGTKNGNNNTMNKLVYKYGEDAKESGETLAEYVADNGTDKEIANLNEISTDGTVSFTIGNSCNDGDDLTSGDVYIDRVGTCQGADIYTAGDSCNDGDPYTTGDVFVDRDGTCVGTDIFAVGEVCDDGDALTSGDVYTNRNGTCQGSDIYVVGVSCSDGNSLTFNEKITDRNGTCTYTYKYNEFCDLRGVYKYSFKYGTPEYNDVSSLYYKLGTIDRNGSCKEASLGLF